LKVQANERGVIESGFRRAEDGWHIVKFLEGIDVLKKKEGEEAANKQGDKLWKIPLVVDDAEDESNEVQIDAIAAENKKGEQMVVDFLGATNLFAAFQKAFPGEVSVFDAKCIDKVKVKLPGQCMRIKTKQNTYTDKNKVEQTAVNIIGFGKMSDKVEDLEAQLFPEKKSKALAAGKKEAKEKAPAATDDEF
jgi:hypothetical protein